MLNFFSSIQRHKLKEYARHDGAKGSPPFGAEGFPLMFDMAAVRKAVKYNKETGKVERDTSDAVFWNSVVNMCKDLWKSSDVSAKYWSSWLLANIGFDIFPDGPNSVHGTRDNVPDV